MSNSSTWRTAWQGQDIVVYRNDNEVDRIPASRIERVIFVYRGQGASVGDLLQAVVQVGDEFLLFPAETGFAGRVNFERTEFWAERACVYWVPQSHAHLPLRLRRGVWWLRLWAPEFCRVSQAELAPHLERWPLEGPQTWEQRKWRRIERSRPFGGRQAQDGDEPPHRARA